MLLNSTVPLLKQQLVGSFESFYGLRCCCYCRIFLPVFFVSPKNSVTVGGSRGSCTSVWFKSHYSLHSEHWSWERPNTNGAALRQSVWCCAGLSSHHASLFPSRLFLWLCKDHSLPCCCPASLCEQYKLKKFQGLHDRCIDSCTVTKHFSSTVPSDRRSAWANYWNLMLMSTSATMRD